MSNSTLYIITKPTSPRRKIMTEANKSTAMKAQTANVSSNPERKVVDSETIQRMASKCTDYNDSRSDARNFKFVEIRNAVFSGEDFCGIETHYSKFADCEFENCKLSRMEAMFSSWENCIFRNCEFDAVNNATGTSLVRNC